MECTPDTVKLQKPKQLMRGKTGQIIISHYFVTARRHTLSTRAGTMNNAVTRTSILFSAKKKKRYKPNIRDEREKKREKKTRKPVMVKR